MSILIVSLITIVIDNYSHNGNINNNVSENNDERNGVDSSGVASKNFVKTGGSANISNSTSNSLKVLFVNARSLLNNFKVQELEMYATEHDLDIIGICETWITSEVNNSEIAIENYSIFKVDRDSIRDQRGGGVLLYVKYIIYGLYVSACNSL